MGATVATADTELGDISVGTDADRIARRVRGYPISTAGNRGRQVARLLEILGRIDGLVNIVQAAPRDTKPAATGVPTDSELGAEFASVFGWITSVYGAWMRSNGGSITNVFDARNEGHLPGAHAIDSAMLLALSRELTAELGATVDVHAIVVGDLDATLEQVVGGAVRKAVTGSDSAARDRQIAREIASIHLEAGSVGAAPIVVLTG